MAATQNTTGTTGNANINGDTLEKLNNGETPARTAAQEKRDDKRLLAISDKACTTALERALGFGKSALHLEIAVAISIFCFSRNGADKEAKRHVMEIYKEAGYDTNPNGEDYKTVNRRINASASLYQKHDRDFFTEAMEGNKEGKAIEALKNFLTQEFNFSGINAVLAAAGKPVKQYNSPEYRAAAAEAEPMEEEEMQAAQGDAGQGGTNEQRQPLTREGTIDERVAPEGGQSLSTQIAQGKISKEEADAIAGKSPEGQAGESTGEQAQTASQEDKATAAAVGERMEQSRALSDAEKVALARRLTDSPNAIVIATDRMHLAIPRDISREELQEMALKIMAFAADMDFEAESKKTQKHQGRAAHTQH